MQALEEINVLEKNEEKGGRRITQSGQRDLDRECDMFIGCESMETTPGTGVGQCGRKERAWGKPQLQGE